MSLYNCSRVSIFVLQTFNTKEMKKNMGLIDKGVRIAAAVAIAILYFTDVINGVTALILGVVALIFVFTSFMSFCPLYFPFKISTRKE